MSEHVDENGYTLPEGADPKTCGVSIHNYTKYKCKCEKCRALKAKVNRNFRYGLVGDEYEKMCEQQNFRCLICKQEKPLYVDHDHAQGPNAVRGLLCNNCNLGIGQLQDNTQYMYNAIDYLNGIRTYE